MKGKQNRAYSFLEFVLQPTKVTRGMQKLTARIKNNSDVVVRNIVLTLRSLNDKALQVRDGEKFIYALMPGHDLSSDFDVVATSDGQVYVSLSGFKNADVFFRVDSVRYRVHVEKTALVLLN